MTAGAVYSIVSKGSHVVVAVNRDAIFMFLLSVYTGTERVFQTISNPDYIEPDLNEVLDAYV